MSEPPTPKKFKLDESDDDVVGVEVEAVEVAEAAPPAENGEEVVEEMEVDGGEVVREVFASPNSTPFLPPENWIQILERRDFSGTDFLSIINTCPEFREMLKTERTTHLLPLALTSVMKYVPSQTFLQFRELTKRTKYEMDKALVAYRTSPSVAFHLSETPRLYLDSQLKRISSNYRFSHRAHVNDFLAHFGNADVTPESHPFPMGHVEFTLADRGSADSQIEYEDYLAFKLLLEGRKFGPHVSSVTFHISGHQDRDARQLFGKLSSLLHWIPNVKHLDLRSHQKKFLLDGEVIGMLLGELVNPMDIFPSLPFLTSLNLDCLDIPENTLNRIIYHYGQQLEGLSINGALFTNPRLKDPDVPLKYLFSQVKVLHVYQPEVNALLILKSLKGWAVELIQFSGVREEAGDAPITQHLEEFCESLFRELGNLKKVLCWNDNKLKAHVFKRPKRKQ
ncbi:hypothetical protein Ocin01_15979 [Orchesella cincta]|uniref:Uncharacterized protein n=1 Tax=Orchesella cincta TaxID=48709 RepID=A0A1D2MCK6_ORCCI|nr:hypothetical protein Ocin01_15979 [Orchesella cincta]